MPLEDVIDFAQAERLIEQHDTYTIYECDLRRTFIVAGKPCRWVVYFQGKAIDTYEHPEKEPKSYIHLADAIEAAMVFNTRREDGEIKT